MRVERPGPGDLHLPCGRILRGIGGGWLAGLASVVIGLLFANRLLPRVYSAISSVWGIAVLIGPTLGGLFADAGSWRAAFWMFAVQGAIVAAAVGAILPTAEADATAQAAAWRQLSMIGIGIILPVAALACLSAWRMNAPGTVRTMDPA